MTPFIDHRPPGALPETLRRFAHTLRRGRVKRVALTLLVIVFAIISSVLTIAPWLFSTDALSRSAIGQLQSASGLFVMVRGPVRLSLTPQPHIVMKNVALADIKGALMIETPELKCTLNLSRLLAGRIHISALTLIQPKAIISSDKGSIVAPGAAMRASLTRSQTPEAQEADAARLGVVNIIDGALTIKRLNGDQIFEKITLSLDWPRVGQPALIAGGVDWRGERHEALLWIARPGLLLRNDPSFLTARFDGKNLNFEAQGFAAFNELPHFSGHLAGRAAAAREALQLFDIHPLFPGALRDAEFSTEAIINGNEVNLKDLRLSVDGNILDGAAELRNASGKLELSATLSSAFLSLETVIADLPEMLNADGQWSHEPFDLPNSRAIDLKLRLETEHARLGRLSLDHASFSAVVHDGALDLGLSRARAYGGLMTASARITPMAQNAIDFHSVAHAEKVDAGALLWDAFGQQTVGGALDIDISLDARGSDVDALMHSVSGQAKFALADAGIEGVDFSRALKLLSTNPLASAQAARAGSSRLNSANATINIINGKGFVVSGAGAGDDYNLTLSGEINLMDRILSLKTVASDTQADHPATQARKLSIVFDLKGGWDDPVWRPDPQSFIIRSGAAATLMPQGESLTPPSP